MIVGLDIGTSYVRVVIGEFSDDGVLQITGIGTSLSVGLRKGAVVNIEATLKAISSAVESAEMMSGREVDMCITGIGGCHIEGLSSRGSVAVVGRSRDSREIGPDDISRAIEVAQAVVVPMDRQMLHVIPQFYTVDDQKGIKDPRDMIGVRLEAEVHIVTDSVTSTQNVVRCVNRAGYRVESLQLKTLAAAQAVMTDEERELGSILIDIGGGTTDVLVMQGGAPLCTTAVAAGGSQVTNDISIINGISLDTSEKIKLNIGCCWAPLIEEDEEIILPGVGGGPPKVLSRLEICDTIQLRMDEIFEMAREKVSQLIGSRTRALSGNVILTGGGALLPGAAELAGYIFNTSSVRIGIPGNMGVLGGEYRSPEFATAAGLILCGAEERKLSADGGDPLVVKPKSKINTFGEKVKLWFDEFF
jgi:cell division protein FtsA